MSNVDGSSHEWLKEKKNYKWQIKEMEYAISGKNYGKMVPMLF